MTIRYEVLPDTARYSLTVVLPAARSYLRLDGSPAPEGYAPRTVDLRTVDLPVQEFATGLGSFRIAFDPYSQTLYLGEVRPGWPLFEARAETQRLRGALRRAENLLRGVKGTGSKRRRAMGRLRRFLATWAD